MMKELGTASLRVLPWPPSSQQSSKSTQASYHVSIHNHDYYYDGIIFSIAQSCNLVPARRSPGEMYR